MQLFQRAIGEAKLYFWERVPFALKTTAINYRGDYNALRALPISLIDLTEQPEQPVSPAPSFPPASAGKPNN
jgi:hypothetical protein